MTRHDPGYGTLRDQKTVRKERHVTESKSLRSGTLTQQVREALATEIKVGHCTCHEACYTTN
jgi:hypothetical protein